MIPTSWILGGVGAVVVGVSIYIGILNFKISRLEGIIENKNREIVKLYKERDEAITVAKHNAEELKKITLGAAEMRIKADKEVSSARRRAQIAHENYQILLKEIHSDKASGDPLPSHVNRFLDRLQQSRTSNGDANPR